MSLSNLRHRLPVRLRQHWKPLTAGIVGVAVALTVFGDVTIQPYSTSANATSDEEAITQDISGTVDLFDATVAHEISLSYSQDDYDRMLDAYFSEGEKEWMTADTIIDGTMIESAAVRLKGNSTLSSLVDSREGSATQGESAPGGIGGAGGGMLEGGPPEGMEMPEGMEPPDGGQVPDGAEQGGGPGQLPGQARPDGGSAGTAGPGGGPGGGAGGFGASLSTEEPEGLPLLVSFNENQPGRAYQGRTELSIRPASASSSSALNEAVALELTAQSGQLTQGYAYTTYTVNDRPATTRLVVENPDSHYADELDDGDGVLYKLLSTSSFEYQGEDQTEYADDFKQVNLVGSQDLQPVISFLRWLENASDEEFESDLEDWVDVESFACYLGTQDVLGNFDTISGPGRNAYLYYDLDTELISVVSWDLNLAFGGMSMPGGGQAGDSPEGGDTAPGGELPDGFPGGELPDGFPGGELPAGFPGGADGGDAGGGLFASNALVTRFEAAGTFADLVEQHAADLRAEWIDGGLAEQVLEDVAARVPVTEGVDQAAIDADVEAVRNQIAGPGTSG